MASFWDQLAGIGSDIVDKVGDKGGDGLADAAYAYLSGSGGKNPAAAPPLKPVQLADTSTVSPPADKIYTKAFSGATDFIKSPTGKMVLIGGGVGVVALILFLKLKR